MVSLDIYSVPEKGICARINAFGGLVQGSRPARIPPQHPYYETRKTRICTGGEGINFIEISPKGRERRRVLGTVSSGNEHSKHHIKGKSR